uniref:Uncharacterized protein n=1 Tax=Arundo donax TaxID=35708 RepID=A0A0A9GV72_ARUDO
MEALVSSAAMEAPWRREGRRWRCAWSRFHARGGGRRRQREGRRRWCVWSRFHARRGGRRRQRRASSWPSCSRRREKAQWRGEAPTGRRGRGRCGRDGAARRGGKKVAEGMATAAARLVGNQRATAVFLAKEHVAGRSIVGEPRWRTAAAMSELERRNSGGAAGRSAAWRTTAWRGADRAGTLRWRTVPGGAKDDRGGAVVVGQRTAWRRLTAVWREGEVPSDLIKV